DALQELQKYWSMNVTSWRAGSDCKRAQGLTCDRDGMITSMFINTTTQAVFPRDTLVLLTRLTKLEVKGMEHVPLFTVYDVTWLKSLLVECQTGAAESIPSELTRIAQLTQLKMSNCGFETAIAELTQITRLVDLELSSNGMLSVWPLNYVKHTRLMKLNLSSNLLTSEKMTELTSLTSLTTLNLSNNQLTGNFPESLTSMSNLVSLTVDFNYMVGTIPRILGNMSKLSTLSATNTSGLKCPDNYTSCGVPQNASSGFCRTCPDFCATCDKPKPAPAVLSPVPSVESTAASGFPTWAIVLIVVAVVAVAAATAVILYYYYFNKSLVSSKAAAQVCQEYSLAAVVKATNGWSEDNILGMGAYGDVYRGVSPTDDATPRAVKRAKVITNDFDTEVCEMATKHHPNLVRLLGFAIGITDKTRVEQILIYELMPNKDLSQWIGKEAELPLSFEQRVDVLVGAARGFEYLHSFGIVHRDIKPANILLDQTMQAKISDFGLVRKGEGTAVQSTRVVGTPGYVDPLYSSSKKATTATDVYSFGILMLELMTGRHVTTNSLVIPSEKEADQQLHLLEWVQQQLAQSGSNRGVGAGLKDPRMEARDELVLRVVQLALRCTDKQSAMRPAMGVIAAELEAVLVALGGARSNSAARQVDQQMESQREPARDLDADFALLDALLADKVNGQHAAAS
ncbi:unnamed protein product, partial [Closterium sp. Naga37s-1]